MRAVGRRVGHRDAIGMLLIGFWLAIAWSTFGIPATTGREGGERLLVADLRGHALVVLDPTRPENARRIPLPGGPHELLRLRDGRIAVSLEQSGVVALVDIDAVVVDSLPTGGLPHGLALQHAHDGDRLLVTDRERGAVRRFIIGNAPATWREVEATPAHGWPHAVVARLDGALAVARAQDALISLDGKEVAVPTLPETVALSPDGTHIATAGAVGGMIQIITWDGLIEVSVEVGGRPVRTVFSPDGSLVAAALSASSAVTLVDRRGVVRRIVVAGTPDGLAFSSDGTRLFAADMTGGRVTVVEVATGRALAMIPVGRSAGSLMVLPPVR